MSRATSEVHNRHARGPQPDPPALVAAALELAEIGYPVFPVQPRNKRPATSHGLRDATLDPDQIAVWWQETPRANVGLLPPENVIVIDSDDPDLVLELESSYPELQQATFAQSPSGGGHHYLRMPKGAERLPTGTKINGRDLDIRGQGRAYLVAPPSVRPNGTYTWERPLVAPEALAECSAELLGALQRESPQRPERKPKPSNAVQLAGAARKYAAAALQAEHDEVAAASEGRRNDQLNKSAFSLGQLVGAGALDRQEVEDALLGAATTCGLSEREAMTTIESGLESGVREPRELPQSLLRPVQKPVKGASRPKAPSSDEATGGTSEDGLPEIIVNGRFMRDIVTDDVEALQAANAPERLFKRAGIMVRIDGEARAEALHTNSLKGELDRIADHIKEEWKTDEAGEPLRIVTPARPPNDVVNDILASQSLPFPELRNIAHVPQVLPGGLLLSRDGYDQATGILLRLRNLDGLRTNLPLERARALIVDELLGDFPFADAGSRAHSVAMLLQHFVMPLITGATPLYLIDAPTRGTGKTLLYLAVAYIVLGHKPAVMTLTRDGDELDKRITASLLEGDVMIVLDNVAARLSSDKLAAVLTARRYRGRLLGKSQMLTVNNDATWAATGNNVEVSDEMARRIMPIRLDAGLERPEEGRTFQHPDLLEFVEQNRSHLVGACLSLINSWVQAGMPQAEARVGSYESWAGIVGGILEHASIPGLLEGRERFSAQADRETMEWAGFLDAWWSAFGERAVSAAELFSDIIKEQNLLMDVWAGRSKLSALQRIGRALSSRRDRVFGKFAIRSAGQDGITKSAAYRLERRTPHQTPETPRRQHSSSQERTNGTGVYDLETPEKPPETPVKSRTNPRTGNGVQNSRNDDSRGFRGFEHQPAQNLEPSDLTGMTEGEL